MAARPEPIRVPHDSELSRLLAAARDRPLVLEADGVRYRVIREDEDLWADYDPEAVRAAVAATAGTWADLDADELIAALYRARREGSRPPDRP
jgi:hypothetical protein